MWCIPKVSGEFGARMEDVLELYAEPLDKAYPVVCMDELSKELHGQVAEPIDPEPGHPAKEDYVSPGEARRIATRLEFHYAAKHGSWLNMAEPEFSALARQCLGRRIETAAELKAEIAAWQRARNEAGAKIDWCFRVADARKKLHWIHPS